MVPADQIQLREDGLSGELVTEVLYVRQRVSIGYCNVVQTAIVAARALTAVRLRRHMERR